MGSTLDSPGIKSELKGRNIWVMHYETTQWDILSSFIIQLFLISYRHSLHSPSNTNQSVKLVGVIRITTEEMTVTFFPISVLFFLLLLGINKIHHVVAQSPAYGTWEYLHGSNEPLWHNILHPHTFLHHFPNLKMKLGWFGSAKQHRWGNSDQPSDFIRTLLLKSLSFLRYIFD